MSAPRIVCLGEALVEFNEGEPGLFALGFGGDTSNCAIAAARQGVASGYVTAVGRDAFGERLLALWSREGVDTTAVAVSDDHPTGHYFVTHGKRGHEFHYARAGSAASRMTASDLPQAYLRAAGVLHVSAISQAISVSAREAVLEAMRIARAAGVRVSFDTNLRLKLWSLEEARAAIGEALALTDVLLPGLDDARLLTGLDAPEAIVDHYLASGPSVVALSLGEDGVLIGTAERREHLPGHAVDCVDATGAGDAFDGAFLAMLVEGSEAFAAARYANAAAAISTTGYGAVAPIPGREAVEEFLSGLDGGEGS